MTVSLLPYRRAAALLAWAVLAWTAAAAAEPAFLHDGDRVALVGDALCELDYEQGWLETALTAGNAGLHLRFRNFGWTGDTVACGARINGIAGLQSDLAAFNPTVVVLAYGMTDSFAGSGRVEAFAGELAKLIAAVTDGGRRLVVMSPIAHENLGAPWPDPAAHNAELARYVEALAAAAATAKAPFIDLFHDLAHDAEHGAGPLTVNGVDLDRAGYRAAGRRLAAGLGALDPWSVVLDAATHQGTAQGATLSGLAADGDGLRCTVLDRALPVADQARTLSVAKLAPGHYTLSIDGQQVASGDAKQWAAGIALQAGPEFDQSERLRQTVVVKNGYFFHEWRPRNLMYLSGGRKKEQGRHLGELQRIEPFTAAQEEAISAAVKPLPHLYTLQPSTAPARKSP